MLILAAACAPPAPVADPARDRDRCPNEPEDRDGFEDGDGCPDPDNDRDGILDEEDPCPDQAGSCSPAPG